MIQLSHSNLNIASISLEDTNYGEFVNSMESTFTNYEGIRKEYKKIIKEVHPLDFDAFIPWVCLELETPVLVDVTKVKDLSKRGSGSRRKSSTSRKSIKLKTKPIDSVHKCDKHDFSDLSRNKNDNIPVKAHYDCKGNLVEVSITGYQYDIHKNVLHAIGFAAPFHSSLAKLSIRHSGVTSIFIYEIGKLLSRSNLTYICLDGCGVAEGNYYTLLDGKSPLQYLSLNRCSINDTMCNLLAEKLSKIGSGPVLRSLDLGSNLISDEGAKSLGDVLRINRHLLSLNLSGNRIGDDGAISLLLHLRDFPVTSAEIMGCQNRKLHYLNKKHVVFQQCLHDATESLSAQVATPKRGKRKQSKKRAEKTIEEKAENTTRQIVGVFEDPFHDAYLFVKNGHQYNLGNLKFCSLNLAYNNLSYFSVKKVLDVLTYQAGCAKPNEETGLMRIIIDGNNIPDDCTEYSQIDNLLKENFLRQSRSTSLVNNISKKLSLSKKYHNK